MSEVISQEQQTDQLEVDKGSMERNTVMVVIEYGRG